MSDLFTPAPPPEGRNAAGIVGKIWNFCNTLRDDGVGYGDYLQQLTNLLFLKLADEFSRPPYSRTLPVPAGFGWDSLTLKRGQELEKHYNAVLQQLSNAPGILGQIFLKSQNKIQDPAKLARLIALIDAEHWATMGADVKGSIYEGLLEKNAEDTKSGAGQYFTPRALIRAMVACVQPEPLKTIADPACGTGGFFLAAHEFLTTHYELDRDQRDFLKNRTFFGNEIVADTRRLVLMNLFLHNIGDFEGENFISPKDALIADDGQRADYVLANPPFGRKSSMTFTNEAGEADKENLTYNRQDFWVTTSNKQLNFIQHIHTLLRSDGRAAVVLPDNVLFEGGAGEAIRQRLLQATHLHTILRLPTGIFYRQGVKANVLFFDNRPASKDPQTREVWFYDFRTNVKFSLKKEPLQYEHLADFIACYCPGRLHERRETYHPDIHPEGRWRRFSYADIVARDKTSLDITWLKDDSLTDLDHLPEPDVLAADILENLRAGLESFGQVAASLAQ